MILIRFILIGLIVYLIVRSFTRYGEGDGPSAKSERTWIKIVQPGN